MEVRNIRTLASKAHDPTNLAPPAVIEEETFELMHEALFPRLSDKNVAVRATAVEACALLQDTGDEKDELTKKVRES